MSVLFAIILFSLLIFAHELGHFTAAKLSGVQVNEFALFMGPALWSKQVGETTYSLRLIPLGGYCAFVGEDEENPAPNAMNNQPVWKRLLTVAAGPAMNFLLAFVFCALLLSNFIVAEYQPLIAHIYADTPAAECGLELGDVIVEINGVAVSYDGDGVMTARDVIATSDLDAPLSLLIELGGERVYMEVQPERIEDSETGEVRYQLGIAFGGRTYRFGEALGRSCGYMVEFTGEMLKALKDLVFHGTGVDDMMGPVGIISFVSDQVSSQKLYAVVNLTFFLSLNIGIMNLLPLPSLDGGRLIFLILEAIRRKPIPPEKEGMVHAIGLGLLLMLFVFITYKDILRLFTGG